MIPAESARSALRIVNIVSEMAEERLAAARYDAEVAVKRMVLDEFDGSNSNSAADEAHEATKRLAAAAAHAAESSLGYHLAKCRVEAAQAREAAEARNAALAALLAAVR